MRCRSLLWGGGLVVLSLTGSHAGYAQGPSASSGALARDSWPQFRGPNGSGVSTSAKGPIEFGPGRNVVWMTALPLGHSSPVIWGDRIFLTAFDATHKKLEVIALGRATGAILWRRDVPADQIEVVHQVSNPATATPVVDAERVYVYFGSYGLIAYDHDGGVRWTVPLPIVQMPYGSGSSPILAGDLLILHRQEPKEPFIAAFDRKTGTTVWKQPYEAPAGLPVGYASHSTPVLLGQQVIVHGMSRVQSYDVTSGKLRWWAAVASNGTSSPVVDGDTIYIGTWTNLGEADQRGTLPSFDVMLKHDADGDGVLSQEEIPADLMVLTRPDTPDVPGATMYVKSAFARFDSNKDAKISRAEWDFVLGLMKKLTAEHGLIALDAGGSGDVTAAVRWREKSAIPEVPSPVVYRGRVYMIRNGGILTSVDAGTGKVVYRERIGAGGPYFASPLVVGERLYLTSGDGVVTVVGTGDRLSVLARNALGESVFASPAAVDGVLYVRTASALTAYATK